MPTPPDKDPNPFARPSAYGRMPAPLRVERSEGAPSHPGRRPRGLVSVPAAAAPGIDFSTEASRVVRSGVRQERGAARPASPPAREGPPLTSPSFFSFSATPAAAARPAPPPDAAPEAQGPEAVEPAPRLAETTLPSEEPAVSVRPVIAQRAAGRRVGRALPWILGVSALAIAATAGVVLLNRSPDPADPVPASPVAAEPPPLGPAPAAKPTTSVPPVASPGPSRAAPARTVPEAAPASARPPRASGTSRPSASAAAPSVAQPPPPAPTAPPVVVETPVIVQPSPPPPAAAQPRPAAPPPTVDPEAPVATRPAGVD